MALTRRQFLKLAGTSAVGSVLFYACVPAAEELLVESPAQLPEDLVTGLDTWYATLCRQCPSPEGIIVRVMEGRAKKVEGNPDYPINRGKHSARCEAGLQALYHPDRIRAPQWRNSRAEPFQETTWDQGLNELMGRLKGLRNKKNMLLITEPLRGHLALVTNRFIESYGGRHMALEPVEETVLRAAIKEVFGQDRLPDFDLEHTQYLLSFGADFLATWVSPVRYARGYGEFRQGKGRKRGTFVQVDSRFSMTAANADEWVPIKPGTEGVLAMGLAFLIIDGNLGNPDPAVVRAMTRGAGAEALSAFGPQQVAKETGLADLLGEAKAVDRIERLAREFAEQRPSLAIGGGSAGAHINGLFNLSAIFALNFLVDSVGKRGGVLFNPHPPLPDVPATATVSPFKEWQTLVSQPPPKLLLIRGANPIHSLPNALKLGDWLNKVEYIVSFSSFEDETSAMANLVLPEHIYLEDWGDDGADPGPGYQTMGFQQPVVNPLYDTQSFADVLLTVAQELGMEQALPWNNFREVLQGREGKDEGAHRLFRMKRGDLLTESAKVRSYGSFDSFWNGLLQHGGWRDVKARAQVSSHPAPDLGALARQKAEPSFEGPQGDDTFYLVPFSSLSLSEGRGAHLPWLQATPDPVTTAVWQTWVEINAKTAQEMDIREGDVLVVESSRGTLEALAYLHPAIPPDVVAIPMGQGHSLYGQYAEERGSNVLSILAPKTEEKTGALAWAATRVRVKKAQRFVRLPKFEGSVLPLVEGDTREVIQVTRQ